MKIAVYAGTFDPPHYGHLDTLEIASYIFDKVIWAIGTNPAKKPMFSEEERLKMMALIMDKSLPYGYLSNVEITSFNGLLVRFAQKNKADFIVRGLRMVSSDFQYEFQMTLVNRKTECHIQTIYIPAKQEYMHMNSSTIRELILAKEDINEYMPSIIRDYIQSIR